MKKNEINKDELNRLATKMSFAIEEASEANQCACQDAQIVIAALTAVIGIRLRKEYPKLSEIQSNQIAVRMIARRAVINHRNFNANETQRLTQGN